MNAQQPSKDERTEMDRPTPMTTKAVRNGLILMLITNIFNTDFIHHRKDDDCIKKPWHSADDFDINKFCISLTQFIYLFNIRNSQNTQQLFSINSTRRFIFALKMDNVV